VVRDYHAGLCRQLPESFAQLASNTHEFINLTDSVRVGHDFSGTKGVIGYHFSHLNETRMPEMAFKEYSKNLSFMNVELRRVFGRSRAQRFLDQMNKQIDWKPVEKVLLESYPVGKSGFGNPACQPLMLLKAILMQKWYGIHSDLELENQINDRISFYEKAMKHLANRILGLLGSWIKRQTKQSAKLREARRFLFIQYETALGAAVNATPMFEAVRMIVPRAYVAVACSGLTYEILKYNPHIDAIYLTPHPLKDYLRTILFFLNEIRKQRNAFDCVILDSSSRRFRFSVLALLTGVPCRIGLKHDRDLHHYSIDYNPDSSFLANNLRIMTLLGKSPGQTEPSIFYSERDLRFVIEFFSEQGINPGRLLVAIQTQTSGGQPSQWYDGRFAEVADNLYEELDAQVLFVGTDGERSGIEGIRKRMRHPSYSAAGITDIPRLAAILCMCDLLITVDTGTMHVGRAVQLPMVIIAPAWQPAHEWLPIGMERYFVLHRSQIHCAHCRLFFCATRECMDEISTDEVISVAHLQLARFPVSKDARSDRVSRLLRDNKAASA
jgi:ADP-heptose:LPS heptosyltransferase